MIVYTLAVISTLLFTSISSTTYQAIFSSGQSIYQLTYYSTTSSLYINFQLYLTPFYSSALLIGRNNNFAISTNRQDWIHFDYLQHNDCDYQGMVTARSQYGWVNNMGVNSTLYLKLINFDTSVAFSYIVNVTESSSFLRTCQAGLNKVPNKQYCAFCDSLHIGSYCQIQRHSIGESSEYFANLTPQSYSYFLLLSQHQIMISLTYDNDIRVYLQTQQSSGELAGVSNYFTDKQGMYLLTANSSAMIRANGGGKSILVGVINPNQNNVLFSLAFQEKQELDVIVIIVSVVGGLIVLGLIIIGFILYKRMINLQRSVHPQQSIQRKNPKFTLEQMQAYFPTVPMAVISFHFQTSFDELKNNEEKNESQCVICLCNILNQELVRVGYCKHIFHANCLYEWFRKQQNCPYCRRDYSRQSTAEYYNKLVKKIGGNLQGQQIVKSLFARKQNVSLNTISFQTQISI